MWHRIAASASHMEAEIGREISAQFEQAAAYLGCSESVLRLWRSQGQGPRYFRAGN